MDIILNILPVFLVIFLGIASKKLGFFPELFVKGANHLVFYIAIPALLFTKLSQAPFHETFDAGLALIVCLSMFLIWISSILFSRFTLFSSLSPASAGSFVQTTMHGNIGYIGLAIVFYALEGNGLRIASFLAPFIIVSQNVLSVLSFNFISSGRKNRLKSLINIVKSIITNPIIISALIGITFSFYSLTLPGFINRSLEIVSGMALPMALLIIGASLTLSLVSTDLMWVFSSSVFKLIFLPGIGLLLLNRAGINPFSTEVAVTLLAMPTATVSVVMSGEMGGNVRLASSAVTLSTLLFAVTICLWTYVFNSLYLL